MSFRLDKTRANSRVAINRRVLTRRSCTDFSDAWVRVLFQVSENCFQDLLNEDASSAVRFMRQKILAAARTSYYGNRNQMILQGNESVRESGFHHCFSFDVPPPCSCARQYRSRIGRSRLFSQRCSSSSVSGCRVKRIVSDFHGREYAFGSSNVTSTSMWPKLTRRNRSVVRNASVCGWPLLSSQLPSLKPAVSTTKVSPSHRPTE